MLYLDTSLILTRYLNQPRKAEAEEIWKRDEDWVASALTVAETVVALRRRVPQDPRSQDRRWLDAVLEQADREFLSVTVINDLSAPAALIRKESRLSSCRTSDAVHVATALWFLRETGRPLTFVSLDGRQRDVASALGLPLLPSN